MSHELLRPANHAAKPGNRPAIVHMPGKALAVLSLCLLATSSFAYVGPGAGLGFIGTIFGIVAALVLAMIGLFWYPLKRVFGKKPAVAEGDEPNQDDGARQ